MAAVDENSQRGRNRLFIVFYFPFLWLFYFYEEAKVSPFDMAG